MRGRARSPGAGERLALAAFLCALVILILQQGWLWRWDQLIYDTQLQFWSRPASSDIVIVAIDEQSLRKFGRWPWNRELHAQLLDRLTAESPRAVAFDIIFAEPDLNNPRGDARLAQAIRRNGRVILPVLMEQKRQSGLPVETLPLPEFAEAAAAMGHVHVELDPDGIARRLFLHEGLGSSFWPHLSLATLKVAGRSEAGVSDTAPPDSATARVWYRSQPALIPYAGPPGHFKRISFTQVIRGEFAPGTFRDRLVLVGTTAAGLGDALPTPVSGFSHSMPGVEINANITDAVSRGLQITPLGRTTTYLMSIILAVLPVLIYPYLVPRSALLLAGLLLITTLGLTAAVLFLSHRWFPPAAALTAIVLGYPLWSWRRLERAMRYLNQELDELHAQQSSLAIRQRLELQPALRFLMEILPIRGWAVIGRDGGISHHEGEVPQALGELPAEPTWQPRQALWSCRLGETALAVHWGDPAGLTTAQRDLLEQLWRQQAPRQPPPGQSADVMQARIVQVQTATRQLQALRRFVDDALANMADGVVVTDVFGQVLLANARAGWYLAGDDSARLSDRPLLAHLQDIRLEEGAGWAVLLRRVLLEASHEQASARHHNGRDMLVQIAPLNLHGGEAGGLVLNFSDISPLKASERRRSELLNFLSHDLRSPLVSLLALIQLAENKDPPPALIEMLGRMRGHAENTITMAEQFLQLARAESSRDYPLLELDLVAVIWNAMEQVWAQARAREINLEDRLSVEEAWIMGDGNLLERALVNLLTNAIKYSPPGRAVQVTLELQEGRYRCCVVDQGYGIRAEALPHLFDRFQRLERPPRQQAGGIGLGLAFVDTVIRRHGGNIEVSSTEGQGSRFCLFLDAILPPPGE